MKQILIVYGQINWSELSMNSSENEAYLAQSNRETRKHFIAHAWGRVLWYLSLGPLARMREQMLNFVTSLLEQVMYSFRKSSKFIKLLIFP